MFRFLKWLATSIVGSFFTAIFFLLLLTYVFQGFLDKKVGIAEKYDKSPILKLDLRENIVEQVDDYYSWSQVFPWPLDILRRVSLYHLLLVIEEAKNDDKIKAIYLKLDDELQAGWASIQNIRQALKEFQKTGKKIYAFSHNYSQKTYYLASLADKVVLYPEGNLPITGLSITGTFYTGLLEKLKIKPVIFKAGKYKSAISPFVDRKYNAANRMQLETLLENIWRPFKETIARERDLPIHKIQSMADLYLIESSEQAKKFSLIDSISSEYELIREMTKKYALSEKKIKKNIEKGTIDKKIDSKIDKTFVNFREYSKVVYSRKKSQSSNDQPNKIALIVLEGSIVDSTPKDGQVDHDEILKELKMARDDDDVKAIVLRINSPGGSALASDIIWREVMETRKTKRIVASFGDIAASGGYYVGSACDAIVAMPFTITGSIGVFSLILPPYEFLREKVGVTFDQIKTAKYADTASFSRPLTLEERRLYTRQTNRVYNTFLRAVSSGRNISIDEVKEMAEGRIWSGELAFKGGLVDELGNLKDSINLAAKLAGLEENTYEVVITTGFRRGLGRLLRGLGQVSLNQLAQNFSFPILNKAKSSWSELFLKKSNIWAIIPQEINIR